MKKLISLPLLLLMVVSLHASKPNVVIVMTDDQGYGDLECHGNPVLKTPHLNRLHNESVRFKAFHVAPMCTPTRGQLMTGMDAFRNGAMNVSSGRTLLKTKYRTMPQYFREGGYVTGVFGKWHLGDNYPFRPEDRGFDESIWFPSSHINSTPDFWDNDYFDDTYVHNGKREKFDGYTTDVFFREAMDWMGKQAAQEKPFFCYIPTAAAHWPHFVPQRFRDAATKRLKAALPNLKKIPAGKQEALASFLAMIENIDENVGHLEDFLRDKKLRDNTIVIFLTDNGSTMGPDYYNAGMKGKKVTLWEGGHRVPLFVRWPNGELTHGHDVEKLTQVQDLLPTLIDLCGLPALEKNGLDGKSLVPLLKGKEEYPDRMLVVNYSRMPRGQAADVDGRSIPRREGAAVLWKHWRLLEDNALYDLRNDPMQNQNVIQKHSLVAKKMSTHLDRWWDSLRDEVNVPARVIIGSEHENPSLLTACEWLDVFIDQQRQVRRVDHKNGTWHLSVVKAGRYRIELSRYPREAGLPIGASLPVTKVTDGEFVAGKELNVASARLKIGGSDVRRAVGTEDSTVSFQVTLNKGDVEMMTWFLDKDDKPVVGAYYAYVNRLE